MKDFIVRERSTKILKYLQKRNLVGQYVKSKQLFENGYLESINFKLRNPRKDQIYAFRINKQFRALGKFINQKEFIVFCIDNHQ